MPKNKLFDTFSEGEESEQTTTKIQTPHEPYIRGIKVPNRQPIVTQTYRIAIVGEAPGRDEELQGTPFVGMSGKLLTGILTRCNIVREACFIGNICQYKPSSNNISEFESTGPEIQDGLKELREDLAKFRPNIVLLLGKAALFAAKGTDKIALWRGSLFMGEGAFAGYKCLASFHPAFILHQYNWSAYLLCDIAKAYKESFDSTLILPNRNLTINLPIDSLLSEINRISSDSRPISVDIEGYWHSLSCCSIANSDLYSFIIPFSRLDGSHYWPLEQEWLVWKAFIELMENPNVPKIFQNGLYDRFCLQYGYGIVVRGNVDDTLLKFWEWRCELRKKLSVQASILTKEPYWKHERLGTKDADEEIQGH